MFPQTNHSKKWPTILRFCGPPAHSTTVFYQPLGCSRHSHTHLELSICIACRTCGCVYSAHTMHTGNAFEKCVVNTWFRSAVWLVLPDQGAGSRQLLPRMLSPIFRGENLGTRLQAGLPKNQAPNHPSHFKADREKWESHGAEDYIMLWAVVWFPEVGRGSGPSDSSYDLGQHFSFGDITKLTPPTSKCPWNSGKQTHLGMEWRS